jgi:hypothetical protein
MKSKKVVLCSKMYDHITYFLHMMLIIDLYLIFFHIKRFGVTAESMPHPEVDFKGFAKVLSVLNDKEPMVWNPATGRLTKC